MDNGLLDRLAGPMVETLRWGTSVATHAAAGGILKPAISQEGIAVYATISYVVSIFYIRAIQKAARDCGYDWPDEVGGFCGAKRVALLASSFFVGTAYSWFITNEIYHKQHEFPYPVALGLSGTAYALVVGGLAAVFSCVVCCRRSPNEDEPIQPPAEAEAVLQPQAPPDIPAEVAV